VNDRPEHVEERDFEICLHWSARFDADYEGDDDGFAWYQRFEGGLRTRLIAAVFEVLRSDPELRVVAAPRGRDPERALDIGVEWVGARRP
jgi:hypothetical protein